jgi:hypothetical protein
VLTGSESLVGLCMYAVSDLDSLWPTHVRVQLLFEVVYVELEFFMLAGLVV